MPWTKHVKTGRDLLRREFEAANKIGDLTFAAYRRAMRSNGSGRAISVQIGMTMTISRLWTAADQSGTTTRWSRELPVDI
jgi:hypothetical protein